MGETKSLKFAKCIRSIIPYIFTSLFGTFIWSVTYIILYFYFHLFVCYIKTNIKFEGKDYLLNLKEYKQHLPRILVLTLIIISFWIIIFFLNDDWKFYIIKSGFGFFILIYIIYWNIYYKKSYQKSGFFDDFYTIFNYIKNNLIKRNNNDIDSNKYSKKKIM
jgi:L-asparagine transporter-like permease